MSMASKKEIDQRKANEQTFAGLFKDGAETPESIVAKVMWGQTTITHCGKRRRITKEMQNAAMALLPYRLPRLNAVDAVTRTVEMTQDEWVKSLAEEDEGT